MLAFYMDHHVHRAITEGLRSRGLDVMTAVEDGMEAADDERLLARATELARILFTQDQDFLPIATRWQREARVFSGLVFAIQQRIDIGRTVEYLELIATLKSCDEMRNYVEYVPSQ
jgi:Domain of unknown function (DUF5615)